jgi:glycosyltransferase involved in cell wall biosynthesis
VKHIHLVRHRGRFDIIYRRHHLLNSEYLLARLFGIPSIKEVNGILSDESRVAGRGDRISLWFMDKIERFNIRRADKIITVTLRLKELLQSDYGIKSERITVIRNGANTDLFKPMDVARARDKLNLSQNHNYVCFTGHLIEWQGLKYLIRSVPQILKQCPETRLLIVGDGPMKGELIEDAEKVGVSDKVTFTGPVPYLEVPIYINASDVCVIPSEKNMRHDRCGGSPLKVNEYMACGKPLVASRLSGLEVIEDSTLGILVKPNDPAELAEAIVKLINAPELRQQMGENGRRYIVDNHSWESVARQVDNVSQSVLSIERFRG